MKLRGLQGSISSAAVAAALLFGAYDAKAGVDIIGPTTVHGFTAQLKGAFQDENNQSLDIIGRESANQKDIAENCLGRSLSRTEKIVLVTDCGDTVPAFEAYVLIVDTDVEPASIVDQIGEAALMPYARKENRDEETTEIEYSISGGLGCSMDLFVQFSGFAKAKFKQLDRGVETSPICTHSANGKGLGTGGVEGSSIVLESLSFKAGSESKKIDVDVVDLETFLNNQ